MADGNIEDKSGWKSGGRRESKSVLSGPGKPDLMMGYPGCRWDTRVQML